MTDLFQPQTTPKRKRNPLPNSAPCLNASANASADSTFTFELPTRSLQRPAPANSDETEDAPPASQPAASHVVHHFRGSVVLDKISGSSSSRGSDSSSKSRGSGSAKCGGGVITGRPREPTRQARKTKDQPPRPQGQGQGSDLSRRDEFAVETKGETVDGKFSEGEEECGEDDLREVEHEDSEDTLAGRKRQKLDQVSPPIMGEVTTTIQGEHSMFVPNPDDPNKSSKTIAPEPAQVVSPVQPTEPPAAARNTNSDESKRAASRKQRRKKGAPDKKKKKELKANEVKAREAEEEKEEEPEIVEPIRAALTWREEEITVYDPEDKDDDGTGINGVGFQPTPELAHAIALKKRQQLLAYKKMVEGDARARRNERRRGTPTAAVAKESPRRRRVRFLSPDDGGCSP